MQRFDTQLRDSLLKLMICRMICRNKAYILSRFVLEALEINSVVHGPLVHGPLVHGSLVHGSLNHGSLFSDYFGQMTLYVCHFDYS